MRSLWVIAWVAVSGFAGCRLDVSGAPCSSDESCPSGQRCLEGRCGVGEASDAGSSGGGGGTGTGGGTTGGGTTGGGTATGCSDDTACLATLAAAGSVPVGCASARCNLVTSSCEFFTLDVDGDGEAAAKCVAGALVIAPGPDCDDSDAAIKAGSSVPCLVDVDGGALFPVTPPVGRCVAPQRTCDASGSGQFSSCTGGVLPLAAECSSSEDFNCNARPDVDDCGCVPGLTRSCFPSATGRPDAGNCVAGTETCVALDAGVAEWSSCSGAVLPVPEDCNGIDDDCDDEVDEVPASGSLCARTGEFCSVGACACPSGQAACGSACVDATCRVGVGACLRTGALVCTGGAPGCSVVAGTPTTDAPCNGIDEDCNGADSVTCTVTGQSCSSGMCRCPAGQEACGGACRPYGSSCSAGVGACLRSGSNSVCSGSSFTCSASAGAASTEVPCNAVDEDCNGSASQSCAISGQSCMSGSCQCAAGQQVCGGACRTYGAACSAGVGACLRNGSNTVCSGSSYTCNVSAGAPGREVECNGVDEDCNGSAAGACSQGGGDNGSSCGLQRYPLDLPDQGYGDAAEGIAYTIGTMPSFAGANRVELYFRTLRPGSGNGSCCYTGGSATVARILCNGQLLMTLSEADFPTGGVSRMVTTSPGVTCQMIFVDNVNNLGGCGCSRIIDSWDAYAYGPRCRTL